MDKLSVESISDFISFILPHKGEAFFHEAADLRPVFRGQADCTWNLLPSTFRTREDFLNEHLYIREFQREFPGECSGYTSFEILVKAQHYGIPTRLLDLTLNPLVALYFACTDQPDSDGVVYQLFPTGVFPQDSIACLALSDYVCKYKRQQYWNDTQEEKLLRSVKMSDRRLFSSDAEIVQKVLSGNPSWILVSPVVSNSRIRAQQGLFALCTTQLVPCRDRGMGNRRFLFPDEERAAQEMRLLKTALVPRERKQDLLFQLDYLGINESVLFPDLEHQARSIVNRVRRINAESTKRQLASSEQ